MTPALELLQKYWGHAAFRPAQEKIITSVSDKHDTLAILPTGAGKSICFQIPGLLLNGLSLVVTPLIALMQDQVGRLRSKNIEAFAVHGGLNQREVDIIYDNCIYGDVKFLYLSPERLKSELLLERVKKMNVKLLAIDEAHCISQWGHDFRPAYLEIAQFREKIPDACTAAFTASATPRVKEDIIKHLSLGSPEVFQLSFSRSNLSFSVRYEENKEKKLLEILQKVPGSSIVYVRTRRRTKELASFLLNHNIKAAYYHGGLNPNERQNKQINWINDKTRVMVATNAFGMGIDKPDVRTVVHVDLPDQLEAYYQEAGRAGRDNKKSYSVLLYFLKDFDDLKNNVEKSYPSLKKIRTVYQCLANHFKVAVGSGLLVNYDFEIETFLNQYGLDATEVYHALKRLESEGLIQMNDAYHNPSKVHIKTDQRELYSFRIAHARFDQLITGILRMYGGEMFTAFMKVSEKKISSFLKISEDEVIKLLEELDKQDVIIYEKRKEKPQITFLTPRLYADKLHLNEKYYAKRLKIDLEKVNAVIHYVKQNIRCRNQVLLAYFGEKNDENCGICDVCIDKSKTHKTGDERVRHSILKTLAKSPVYPEQVIEASSSNSKETALNMIRVMLDNGDIQYNAHGMLEIRK